LAKAKDLSACPLRRSFSEASLRRPPRIRERFLAKLGMTFFLR
jgi:hypothetical protein